MPFNQLPPAPEPIRIDTALRAGLKNEAEIRILSYEPSRIFVQTRAGQAANSTAGQLVACDPFPDGRSLIRLRGGFRFTIERELDSEPYRQAMVRPLPDPAAAGVDGDLQLLRSTVLELAGQLGHRADRPVAARHGQTVGLPGRGLLELFVATAEHRDLRAPRAHGGGQRLRVKPAAGLAVGGEGDAHER